MVRELGPAVLVVASLTSPPAWSSDPRCHENPTYFVVEHRADVLAKAKTHPSQEIPCEFVPEARDFQTSRAREDDPDADRAYYFVALKDDLLVVEQVLGSGVTEAALLTIDLKSRRISHELHAYDELESVDDSGVSFWTTTTIKPDEKNCPDDYKIDGSADHDHAQAFIQQKMTLDFASRTIIESPTTRCAVLAD